MLDDPAARVSDFVTSHDLLVIVLLLVLTAGVGAGLPQLDIEDQTDIDDEVFSATEVGQALEYVDSHYGEDETTAVSSVYVRPEDGNALSREALLETLA